MTLRKPLPTLAQTSPSLTQGLSLDHTPDPGQPLGPHSSVLMSPDLSSDTSVYNSHERRGRTRWMCSIRDCVALPAEQRSRDLSQLVWCVIAQLCLTLGKPVDCSLPHSSVHWIFQARILEWVAVPFSRGSS